MGSNILPVLDRQLRQAINSHLFRESATEIGLKSSSTRASCNIQATKAASSSFLPCTNAQPVLSCSAEQSGQLRGAVFLMRLTVLLSWKYLQQVGEPGRAPEKKWKLIP